MLHKPHLSDTRRALLDRYRRGELVRGISSAILRKGNEDAAPLSLGQEQLWIHCRIAPDLPIYNEPVTVTRHGPLNIAVLERSFTEIVRRHEAWRTTFDSRHGVPLQIVQPPRDVQFPVADLRVWPSQDREAEALRLATADARYAFDLTRGPLVRPLLVRMADDEHRLYLSLHQIIFDGVSMYTVFLPELTSLYEAFAKGHTSPLSPLSIQYSDFAEWQHQSTQAGMLPIQLAYWRKQLQGAPAVLELSTDRPRPAIQSFRGAQRTFAFSLSLTHALRALSQAEGVTLFVTLLSGFKALLFRYTGQDDIVVGTVTTTRKRSELQGLLGFFLNTLALRTSLAGDPTFRELLRRVREVTLDALCHADVPVHHVVQAVQPDRDPSRSPLFQVMFVLEPPLPPPPIGWNLTQMDVDTRISRVDLYFELDERPEGLIGRIRYNTDLFDAASIDVMQHHFEALLDSVVARPEQRISRLPLIDRTDHGRPIRHPLRFTTDFEEFPVQAIEQTIHQRFERQVEKHPLKVALRTADEEWTYDQLNRAANIVAHAILAIEPADAEHAALLFSREPLMIAGMLGALKAGRAYVPLDPTHPTARLSAIQHDARSSVIVASRRYEALARQLGAGQAKIIIFEEIAARSSNGNPNRPASPDDLAYLLYTSGSTGRPKGILQNHRNVLHFIRAYTNNLCISPKDGLTLLSSCSVDAAVMDLYGALLNGATLYPINANEAGLAGFRNELDRPEITIYHSTPTLFRHLVSTLSENERLPHFRLVVLGGEEAVEEDVEAYRQHFGPACVFVNGFGPTESTVALQYFLDRTTRVERHSVPIGYPVVDTEVWLLDEAGVPGQLRGELAIRSAHLALGYWQRPDLTEAAFRAVSTPLRQPDSAFTVATPSN